MREPAQILVRLTEQVVVEDMEKPSHSDEAIEECLKDLVSLGHPGDWQLLISCRVLKFSTGDVWISMHSPFARSELIYAKFISNGVAATQPSEHGPRRKV